MIDRQVGGLYHPASESEVTDLVCMARARGAKLRVRGAAHSTAAAILTGNMEHDINVLLDRMTRVWFDDATQQVTVEAGCTLTALFQQLDQRGWALPSTAGITHQTVAGFLSTGSSGGSALHSIGRQVVAIRLVGGHGVVHELRRDADPDNPFFAAGVSLGLLGIITAVTFQCVDRFTIIGAETTPSYGDCEVDLFGSGTSDKPDLEQFFRTREHAPSCGDPRGHRSQALASQFAEHPRAGGVGTWPVL
jgi:FAD/FMN-containing dehydrogenase